MDENNAVEGLEPDAAPTLEVDTDAIGVVESDGQGSDEQNQQASRDRKLARENQALRKRLREAEAAQREREEAELSEQERVKRRMVEMEQTLDATRAQVRDARLTAAISATAPKYGITDPVAISDAARLLDLSDLDYDDDAGWSGIGEALQALTVERPWLVQTGTAPAMDANPANPARRRSRVTKEQLASMTQAEIDALPMEDVMAALSER
jgi:hypothetical protein